MRSPIHNPLIDIHVQVKILGPKDPALSCPKETAQGTGHKVKTIKENSFSPYALRVTTQSAERKAKNWECQSSLYLYAMRSALCDLTWPQGPGFLC
jgi:hypothetical protein